ncbi:DUF1003 domain-containing protein [Flavobacterium humi]|uniref:DUF1003 domain-containing protein n=1 Tax=Flavobacterium humi TaxID=2562683 RepID=A0A4Z0LD38_9FLAO|nr:DUF1003 domain-containing protein [Flavobacterium humi]TGD59785.1 DUF1003 domain-containing protein [Flavobacterium humi]
MGTFKSAISGKEFPETDKIMGQNVGKSIFEMIKKEYPEFKVSDAIAAEEFGAYRDNHMSTMLLKDIRQLTKSEQTVMDSLNNGTTITDKVDGDEGKDDTFGQRIADKVAEFGGSWTFILSFVGFLVIWILTNVLFLVNKSFDPYPFILLNLILSCIAALQAPVIMMSQNRQEEKDRDRAKNDYMINLKSELEIRLLHEKIDHLIIQQEEALIQMQKQQIERLEKIIEQTRKE